MRFIEETDADSCAGYLEHIINALGESGADFHDKLAELYLVKARLALKEGAEGESPLPHTVKGKTDVE